MVGTKTPDSREEQDQAYNPGELHAAEQFPEHYTSSGLDQLEAFANDPTNASKEDDAKKDPSANIQNVQEAEKQPQESPWDVKTTPGGSGKQKGGPKGFMARIWGKGKKKGPIIAILSTLGVGGLSIASLPSLLPQIPRIDAETMYDNVSRSNVIHNRMSLRNLIGNRDACAGNPGGIRCKLATVNDKTIANYEKQGFKIETTKAGDRHLITAATFPDGERVTTGAAFVAKMDASVSARSVANAAFDARNSSFVGRKFNETLQRFGLAKDKIILSDKDKESAAKSFNEQIKAPDDKSTPEEKTKKVKEDLDVKAKGVKMANAVGALCGAYNLARLGINAVKFENASHYIALLLFYLKLSDQARTGDLDAATVSIAMGALTKTSSSGENAGKNAFDSPGFKAMAGGDRTNLSSAAQKILLGGNPALVKIDTSLIGIKDFVGAKGLHYTCKIVNNDATGALLSTATCTAGGALSGTVVPILGNVVGGAAGLAVCVAIDTALAIGSGIVIGKIIEALLPTVVGYLDNATPNFDMSSVDLGNAFTIGAGLMFGLVGLSHGGKIATKDEALNFQKVTYESNRQYEEVARYDARSTPFDASNQYSFMGMLVSRLGLTASTNNPVTSTLSTIGSIFGSAKTSLLSPAFAADMPSSLKETTLGTCKDPELRAKNFGCDAVGGTQIVQTEAEMNAETDTVAKYMIKNDYVNNEGTVNEEKDYAKYLKYCTGEDTNIPGVSTLSLEDDDYDWPDKKCQDQNEMMSNFRTYTARVTLADDRDTYYDKPTSGTAPTTPDPGTVTPGGAVDGDDYKAGCNKYAFCTGQCVDFVLFRLVKHGVLPGKQHMGNGKDVAANLGKQLNIAVDTTPAVHSVMSTSHTSHPDLGHTAMVAQVNSDGSIVVEEYNYTNPLHYDTRTISAAQIKADGMTFAHTETLYK
jgi:surface antigen